MRLTALTIFASAFLLFLLQPIIAKQILPWFGGSAAVWTTCLVFFQSALLLGYAYADAVVRKLIPRVQVRLHAVLLIVSLIALPIIPGEAWKPLGTENPVLRILGLLTATIGLPYFLLSTTSPLLQAWFARRYPGPSPYRLFALSNLASMLALLGYPFLLEPFVPTRLQAYGWSIGYALFVGLACATAFASLRAPATAAAPAPIDGPDVEAPPPIPRQILWCVLAGTASLLLLATTNHITQNIAAVPLLWIVPLAIYLLTFIVAFGRGGLYVRDMFLGMAAAALAAMGWTLGDSKLTHDLALQLGVFNVGLALACMFCHGELARLRPAPRYLTRFYLMVAAGGAGGAALVAIVAPLVLPAHFELEGGLVLCALLFLWQVRRDHWIYRIFGVAAVAVTLLGVVWSVREFYDSTTLTARNFYGVLRVQEFSPDEVNRHLTLMHGTIMHGRQYLEPDFRRQPSTYYTRDSGIGRVIESLHPSLTPLKVGIIGLGAGTIAAYGAPDDVYRFYDINPAVVDIARNVFTYLKDSDAKIEIALGDARLSLEREPPQNFDVLAIDAFSSDAIPVHLITSEALSVYERHMKPTGIIAFHVTNRYLDLAPVVEALATAHGLAAVEIHDTGLGALANSSDWVLVARDPAVLKRPLVAEAAKPITPHRDWRLWTDDFNNLFQVLRRD